MDLIREVSLNSTYNDAGEPDTGFLPKGKVRKLGIKSNKPEPWFEKGGYTQWSYPKATTIYNKKDKSQASYCSRSRGGEGSAIKRRLYNFADYAKTSCFFKFRPGEIYTKSRYF